MAAIIARVLSFVFYIYFVVVLLMIHPLQWVAHKVFGLSSHQKMVLLSQRLLMLGLRFILFNRFRFTYSDKIDYTKKYLIVSNRQSALDIPPLYLLIRKFRPIFTYPKRLRYKIPTVSYSLREVVGAMVSRRDLDTTQRELKKWSLTAMEYDLTPVLYPEGRWARSGRLQKFSSTNINIVLKYFQPDYILPVVIMNNHDLTPDGFFPCTLGNVLRFEILDPVEVDFSEGVDIESLKRMYEERLAMSS